MNERRQKTWGFPRWSGYGSEQTLKAQRICDHSGCNRPGDHPAPKAPHSQEKWWFCLEHVEDYNRNWNYFEGLSAEEAKRVAEEEEAKTRGHARSSAWSWAQESGKFGSRNAEIKALEALELDEEATPEMIKRAYRRLAKRYHPDTNPNNDEAAQKFQEIRAAFDFLNAKAIPD